MTSIRRRLRGWGGADDADVLEAATQGGRLLVTLDRGLGDVRTYPPATRAGVLVVRLDNQSPRAVRKAVVRIAETIDLDELHGCVAVWRAGALRVRRGPR